VQVAAAGPISEVLVTARGFGIIENVQQVAIPITVVGGEVAADAGAFNVGRLRELVPSLQFYSTNPRNSFLNIRGLGLPFGLANDGIEPGVGLYIDGVFHARPAAATLDFLDVERIEVLRGPQGTLYGKNTTAGAINVTTRRPEFAPSTDFEVSYGNLGFLQAKVSTTGALTNNIAARLSFAGTQRDGVLYNTTYQDDINDLNNLGVRSQVLFSISENFEAILSGDYTRQRPEGYAQVIAGVAPTLRSASRQWPAIADYFNYEPPSYDGFDRFTDADTVHNSYQDLGGAALIFNYDLWGGTFTSISAWRYWDWKPKNDRDFTGLPITTISANPSQQEQWMQEFRYAGQFSESLNFVLGAFGYRQTVEAQGQQEQGSAAARFLISPTSAGWDTPGLLDGYGRLEDISSTHTSAAIYGQLEWFVTPELRVIPGLRVNYDRKEGDYESTIYGGLQTNNSSLIALQRGVLAPQTYDVDISDWNLTGQLTVAYQVTDWINAYATFSTAQKSVGINVGGLPTDGAGDPILESASVKPERVRHYEVGVKTEPFPGVVANLTGFYTTVEDFQAQVFNAQIGVARGYLANAEEVRVHGVEFDGSWQATDNLFLHGAVAYTEAVYVSFPDAPAPLEGTGGPSAVDISGQRLPGVSKWSLAGGGEYSIPGNLWGREGEFFGAVDMSYRSGYSSSPTPSAYLNVEAYSLTSARAGFRGGDGWDVFFWGRNIFDKNYYEQLSAPSGGTGLYAGVVGDPRTFGVTLRGTF